MLHGRLGLSNHRMNTVLFRDMRNDDSFLVHTNVVDKSRYFGKVIKRNLNLQLHTLAENYSSEKNNLAVLIQKDP